MQGSATRGGGGGTGGGESPGGEEGAEWMQERWILVRAVGVGSVRVCGGGEEGGGRVWEGKLSPAASPAVHGARGFRSWQVGHATLRIISISGLFLNKVTHRISKRCDGT
jgi:hypothetical protein